MQAKLVVVGGDVKATEIRLRLPAVVGRGKGVTLTVPHPLVSRRHCELFEQEGVLMVRDLESLNGTFVGNQKVVGTAPVPAGELLTVATVNFRVDYGDVSGDSTHPTLNDIDASSADSPTADPSKFAAPSRSAVKEDPSDTGEFDPVAAPKQTRPVERDTEWQLGNLAAPRRDGEDDDLSTFIDDTR